jgi:hypothetical protein
MTVSHQQDVLFRFGVTFDYRCPFARNLHEHVVSGLDEGAPWDVAFLPFSLNQVHVAKGEPDIWDDPDRRRDLLAMQVGIAVRDGWPERFPHMHLALFAARHDRGLDLRDEGVLRAVLERQGLDADDVLERVATGATLEAFRREHDDAVARYAVFGVPTIVVDDRAAFIRLLHRPNGDGREAVETMGRLLELVAHWPQLNELKFTKIPR